MKTPHWAGFWESIVTMRFQVLDRDGRVMLEYSKRARGSAFEIDEARARHGKQIPRPMAMSWKRYLLMLMFFPLLLPIDLWLRKRLK